MERICLYCGKPLAVYASKYCSNLCQGNFQYESYVKRWKMGEADGSRGQHTKNFSKYVIRYLFEKYSNHCAQCGWAEINLSTMRVPLEVDHIDGNSENNSESNLILLCPNCHSLTSNYKNLNKGSGRLWRREKYVKID